MVSEHDRIIVESEKLGQPPRSGVVNEIHGNLIRIAWDDGGESTMVPSAGSLRVIGSSKSTHNKPNRA
jgi:hypothetical protein